MTKYAHQCAACRNWFLSESPHARRCEYCVLVAQHEARERYYRHRHPRKPQRHCRDCGRPLHSTIRQRCLDCARAKCNAAKRERWHARKPAKAAAAIAYAQAKRLEIINGGVK